MKAGNKASVTGLRNIIGKLKTFQIDKGKPLTNEDSQKILKSAAKQLKESIEQYQNGGRDDLAEKELFELSLLDKYLPKQLSKDKLREIIKKTIQTSEAESMKDLGKIMGRLMKEINESADGKLVHQIVREELS